MSLQLLTPPTAEPVTLAEAKAHLRLDTSDEDALVTTLITASRARAEWHTGRAFVTQSWCLRLDGWPVGDVVEVPLPPLIGVDEVAVTDADNVRSVLDPSCYRVDTASEPGRVMLAKRPPSLRHHDSLEITFTAGYGAEAAVPVAVKQAILEIVADLHAHRGDVADPVGRAGQILLAPYRIFKM
jgi:uncharacterized phiE125 gp8 family phage protein